MKLDKFTQQYVETALWASTDDNDRPMDDNFAVSDIAEETLREMIADCESFQSANAETLQGFNEGTAGHDFWLTRNRHGAGFWDGDYPEAIGKVLTEASHAYGSFDLYIGDDGKVYGN